MNSGRLAWLKRGESDLPLFNPNNANEERAGSMSVRAVAMFAISPSGFVAPGLMASTSAESASSSYELVSISTSACSTSVSPANKSQTNNTPHADKLESR